MVSNILSDVKFTDAIKITPIDTSEAATKEENLKKLMEQADILAKRVKEVENYQEYEMQKEKDFKDKIEHANSRTR